MKKYFNRADISNELEIKYEKSRHDDTMVVVLYKNEEVYRWHDNANIDYPEDLTWDRMISEAFYAGVELGKRVQKEALDSVCHDNQHFCQPGCDCAANTYRLLKAKKLNSK